jgi:hypothetical protein
VGRLGIGAVCAGVLMGAACSRDGAGASAGVVGPRPALAESDGELSAPAQAATTQSTSLTPDELMDHGWSCRVTPDPTRRACSPPGRGLPVFGAPADRPPSYLVHVFDTVTGQYLGFGRMIRTDLYEGQICPSTGAEYGFLPHIGYYECFKPVS